MNSNMSVYSANTGLSSILKAYSPAEREKAKNAIINKVRFEMPKRKGLLEAIEAFHERDNYQPINEYVDYLRSSEINDMEFLKIINDARTVVYKLSPKFTNLVESLIALPWSRRTPEAIQAYSEFAVDIMVAHNKYTPFCISKYISQWIPGDTDAERWPNGTPDDQMSNELKVIHKLLDRILTAIPMSFDVILDNIENKFPYFKKAAYIVAGYLHNILWLMDYKPMFSEFAIQLIIQKLIVLDVNAPRHEIEEIEDIDESDDDFDIEDDNDHEEQICENSDEDPQFEMDDCKEEASKDIAPMNHLIAHTLDICLEKLYIFLDAKKVQFNFVNSEEQNLEKNRDSIKFFKFVLSTFDNVILPSHNTHHVQFLIFYYCSFKTSLAELFLNSLWEKIKNPNVSAVIRQASVGYMASYLARYKGLPLTILKHYLKELCDWAHSYIERCDQYRSNGSLKANIVFFTTCQAIFYIIAFRSKDLTSDKKNLLFLQSLQLSALVTCNFNPLRVCLPPVATAFAGVTRAYQLAYCHAILERNARRKLATVYANETATAEEVLDTFFPFDPYLLKISCHRISPHYLQYQASAAEELNTQAYPLLHSYDHGEPKETNRRKRGDSEMVVEDVDDFLICDKRRKLVEIAKSQERESQFTYGLSPGFHM